MKGKIFLIDPNGELVPLEESPYSSEDRLQGYLAKHPDLLAGDQINDSAPRRWLLIDREVTVPDTEAGSGRWSIDHVFVDQDGIPTLVEVKRSSDTRLRREVVGQLLEYAAHAASYWSADKIEAEFDHRCNKSGLSPADELRKALGVGGEAGAFWDKVKTNLQLGKLRLLFVADVIPSELQRIVEFLNEQMDRTEVLAVEIRQFEGSSQRTLVPRVIGQTSAAVTKKGTRKTRAEPWDEDSFLERLDQRNLPESRAIAASVLDWAKGHGLRVEGGRGAVYAGLQLRLPVGEETLDPLYLYEGHGDSPAYLQIQFDGMGPDFKEDERRRDLAQRLNGIPGLTLSPEKSYPSISFNLLADPEARVKLFEALDWLYEELAGDQ